MTESPDRNADACRKLHELLPSFFDGELSPREVELVSAHTSNCLPCEGEIARLDRLHILLKGSIEERADAIDPQAVWQQIDARLPGKRKSGRAWLSAWWNEPQPGFGFAWPAVAALAVAFLALALFLRWGDLRQSPATGTQLAYDVPDWADVPAHIQQIESDSPMITVLNDPRSSAAVIWVSDKEIVVGGQAR